MVDHVKALSAGLSITHSEGSEPDYVPWSEITALTLTRLDTPAGTFRHLVIDHESGHYLEVSDDTAGFGEVLQELPHFLPGVRTDLAQAFDELAADGDLEIYRRKDLPA